MLRPVVSFFAMLAKHAAEQSPLIHSAAKLCRPATRRNSAAEADLYVRHAAQSGQCTSHPDYWTFSIRAQVSSIWVHQVRYEMSNTR